ncbi:pentatricopeptide repeat-containing protein At5g13770, chloroplastic-like [Aristolochia californica]|uniref:pentatricopeptide repeat-containing protein At5g13770, chloroplastic-like n=1 Tax=Aristolochia californica TaxID=171875 RepID=UPI0035D87A16
MALSPSRTLIPCRRSLTRTKISLPNLPFLSVPSRCRPFLPFCSCRSSSPLLEDPSNDLSAGDWHIDFPNPKRLLSDPFNFNQSICNLCKDPRTEALAFDYYQKAKNHPNFRPNELTLKLLIRFALKFKHWGYLVAIAEDFRNFRVFPDVSTCEKMMSRCVRARKIKVSESLLRVFESEREMAVAVFDSAMSSYNKLHMYMSTISVYEQMRKAGISPDSRCYYRIMEAYWRTEDTDNVISLFHEFENRKVDSDAFSTKIYWILCDSLGKSGRPLQALEFFRGMAERGIPYDYSFYSSLICSFAKNKDVKQAESLFLEAKKKAMVKDSVIFLNLVLMYVEQGLVDKTLERVKEMIRMKSRVSDCIFCAVINGYAKKRGSKATIRVYNELTALGCEPGQVTYASIINAYSRLGLFSKAEMVFHEMRKKGFDKCVVAYANMISIYGKQGRLNDAMKLVAKMKERGCEPNVWVYNTLMDMHGRVMNLRQVEKLWKEMKRRKVAPDKVSYTSLISAYNRARELEECMRFYREFRLNGGRIDLTMGGIMVNVFSKSSRIDELIKLLQEMKAEGTRPDGRLYKSAINCLRDSGLQVHVDWFQESFG